MKNYEILNGLNRLNEVAELSFPIKITYAIKKNIDSMMKEYKIYEDMLDKVKEDDEKLNDLLSLDVDIEIIKINESELLETAVDLNIKQLDALMFMIEQE